MKTTSLVSALTALILTAFTAQAATPVLTKILPRGAKRGAEHTISLRGDRLSDAAEIVFYTPGFIVSGLEVVDPKHVKAKVKIAPDAALGEHLARVRTKSGLSAVRSFWVGQFDNTAEKEPNSEFETPQAIPFNTTVEGVIQNEDVDHFIIDAKKGQRISAEVEGIRLGNAFFDPYVAILNTERFELAASDDTSLLLQDPTVSIVAPADGKYIVRIRDSSYTGNGNCHYRLHIGAFPRPLTAFPAGGKTGTDLAVKLLGDPAGDASKQVKLTAETRVRLDADNLTSPAPLPLRSSPFDNVIETEPNNNMAQATKAPTPLPLAFNGIIEKDGDDDWFSFEAKKDQRFLIRAHAKSIGSPLDPVVNIFGPDKKHLLGNDDADGQQDSKVDFKAPVDGLYSIRVRDHLKKGSARHVYRIEAEAFTPSLKITIPYFGRNDSQSRQMIYVPQGGRFSTRIVAAKSNFGGDLVFEAPGVPKGVSFKAQPMHTSINTFPVLFEAAADAPLGVTLIDLIGKKKDDAKITGTFSQPLDLVMGQPNNTVYYQTRANKLAVAVVEKLPFTIEVEVPKVPLVRNGTLAVKVVAKRDEGFDKPITLRNLWNPPGLGSQPTIKIEKDKTEAVYTFNANGSAALQTWHLAVMAESDAGAGQILTSSSLFPITVAEPYLGMKLEMAAVEQGKPGIMVAKLENLKPFNGKATIQLHGLPGKVTSETREITKDTKELQFPLVTAKDSPKGQHKNVFGHVAIPDQGGSIPHNIGHGGVIRIDPPPPAPKKKPAAKPSEKKPEPAKVAQNKPAPKPLSRLEKLRQEAANK